MHNLILLDPAPAGRLTTAEIDLAMAYAEAGKAPATQEAYMPTGLTSPTGALPGAPRRCPHMSGSSPAYLSSLVHHRRRRGPDVKRYAASVGLDPAIYSGHSLRAGFPTSAAEAGASVFEPAEVSRHKSLDTLRGYIRRVDLFCEHARAAFL